MKSGEQKSGRFVLISISACITGLVLLLLYYKKGYLSPNGSNIAWEDAQIQYLDFFNYLKNVLRGEDSLLYSMQKGLGGSGLALFAYYLASPLNAFVVFTPRESIPLFLNLLFVGKAMLAATAFAVFLTGRFGRQLSGAYTVIFSVSYALMQYSIAQASNIMWMDGVYMLPLILLAVYRLIRKGRTAGLSLTIALSVLFNWYTGGINCLFAGLWFFAELMFYRIETGRRADRWIIEKILLFGVSVLLGLGLSMWLFLPNYFALRSGKGAEFLLSGFRGTFLGNIVATLQNHTIGATSTQGSAALFSGSLVLLGVLSLFRSKLFSTKEKIAAGVIAGTALLTLYFQPFVYMFSLLQFPNGHWYRYSYVDIFVFLFMAAAFFSRYRGGVEGARLLQNGAILAGVLLMLDYVHPVWDRGNVCYTVLALLGITVCVWWYGRGKGRQRVMAAALLCIVAVTELAVNANALMNVYRSRLSSDQYREYAKSMTAFWENLKTEDSGVYRISQTFYRDQAGSKISPFLNDGLAYGFPTTACYTSCTENVQLELMERLGYRKWVDTLCVVNTSVLPADSLLGVKYIASNYPINGLDEVYGDQQYMGKTLYRNPYALPLLYLVKAVNEECEYQGNPFSYQNQLCRAISSEDRDVFVPLTSTESEGEKSISYTLTLPQESCAVYGNFVMPDVNYATIAIDGEYWMTYAGWLSSSVFYVPVSEDKREVVISIEADKKPEISEAQFYYTDLAVLKSMHDNVEKNNTVSQVVFENGNIECSAYSDGTRALQTSVMDTDGWEITVNGEKVAAEQMEGMLRVPLARGENTVRMKYHVPGLIQGITVSVFSVLLLIGTELFFRRRRNQPDRAE